MLIPKFNAPLGTKGPGSFGPVNVTKLETIKNLLQRRYKQTEIAEMMGMTDKALSRYLEWHGLKKPR